MTYAAGVYEHDMGLAWCRDLDLDGVGVFEDVRFTRGRDGE